MRTDQIAKRFFTVGCFGLPWLWAVHLLYWWGKQRHQRALATASASDPTPPPPTLPDAGLLTEESYETHGDEPADPEEMLMEEKKWVRREFVGVVMVSLVWLTWIICFQVLKEFFPPWMFVRSQDDFEHTGW